MHSALTPAQRLRTWLLAHVGRGRHRARHAAGGVRVAAAPRADRGRRGARRVVQAAGRCALLGARPGGVPRPARARAGGAGLGHAVAGDAGSTRVRAATSGWPWTTASAGAALPRVRVFDMGQLPRSSGQPPPALAPPVLQALRERLERGEQSLVFLNRRGYAPVLQCLDCGWKSDCPHCSAWRVFHKIDRTLRCHHCGLTERVPRACPSCGNLDIAADRPRHRAAGRAAGAGAADGARIARIDADAARGKGALEGAAGARCTPATWTSWSARRW